MKMKDSVMNNLRESIETQSLGIRKLESQLAECRNQYIGQAEMYEEVQRERDHLERENAKQGALLNSVVQQRDELLTALEVAVKLNSFREFNDHIPAIKSAIAKVKP